MKRTCRAPRDCCVELPLTGGVFVTYLATEIRQNQHSDLIKNCHLINIRYRSIELSPLAPIAPQYVSASACVTVSACATLNAVDGKKNPVNCSRQCSAVIDVTHEKQKIIHVIGGSNSLSLCRSLIQFLRSCVMRRSVRCHCVCSIISPFVQSGGDLAVDVNFCRVPFDTKSKCRVVFSLSSVTNSSQKSALPSLFNCLSPRKRLLAIRTTYSLSDLISRFPSCTRIAANCCEKLRTVVGLLTPMQSERTIPVFANTEEDSTARSSESRILTADACNIRPRHNAVVILSFTFGSRVC